MNTGVSIAPCGVFSRPTRAPLGSVFPTSNEKFTHRVYQEKINAHPTRHTTYAAQTDNAMVNALLPRNFFGLVAASPMASKISIQIVKTSIDFSSATSHFAASSGKTAPRLVATGLSRSTLPYGIK